MQATSRSIRMNSSLIPWLAINFPEQPLEFVAGDRSLKFLQCFPIRRIGEGIAETIDRGGGGGQEEKRQRKRERKIRR